MENTKPCIDCYHFKTRIIPKNKLKDDEFFDRALLKKQFAKRKTRQIRIYYCLFEKRPLLESERVAFKVNRNCDRGDF